MCFSTPGRWGVESREPGVMEVEAKLDNYLANIDNISNKGAPEVTLSWHVIAIFGFLLPLFH